MFKFLKNYLKARFLIGRLASTSITYDELVFEVMHDKEINSLLSQRTIWSIVNDYSTVLS